MSVGFGFSVGNFITAIELICTIVDALRQTSRSKVALKDISTEPETLKTTLTLLKRLEDDEEQRQRPEFIAICEITAKSQSAIAEDPFCMTIQKYAKHLQAGGTGAKVKDGWAKVVWAILKKEDLENFRIKLRGHATSLTIALLAAQANALSMSQRQQTLQYKSLASLVQGFAHQSLARLATIHTSVSEGVQQIIRANLQIFTAIHAIHQYILQVPGQVERQQPVFLIDCLGKYSPFYLEFIRSAEALKAVLKANLKASDCGSAMIDAGDFVIEDTATSTDIDLDDQWESCFFPGQRAAMSMKFMSLSDEKSACPNCSMASLAEDLYERLETCSRCSTTYRWSSERRDPGAQRSVQDYEIHDGEPVYGPEAPKLSSDAGLRLNMRRFRRLRLIQIQEHFKSSGESGYKLEKREVPYSPPHDPYADWQEWTRPPPTYVRAHKRHLSPETLQHYRIPYQDDGDHLIILKRIDQGTADILFEHTTRLRLRDRKGALAGPRTAK